jgi:hypothetical protein
MFTNEEIKKKIFDFTYLEALDDAIQQKAYEGGKRWINDVEEPKLILQKYINKIMDGEFKTQEEHDNYFYTMLEAICKKINKVGKIKNPEHENEFSFGNAQKLVNITVKYFYSYVYFNPDARDAFQYCHCPMDSKILAIVWDNYHSLKTKKINLGTKTAFTSSWGKENFANNERYMKYQKAVRELSAKKRLTPIEFDYFMWKRSK